LLHYAPVNQADLKLSYKLPSILVRLTQLHWIEQLRRLFASKLQIYSLTNVEQMLKPVAFSDCLTKIDHRPVTPLFILLKQFDLMNFSNTIDN
ncbi:unnamed protein product, partial [Rotaria magnacalcarata]